MKFFFGGGGAFFLGFFLVKIHSWYEKLGIYNWIVTTLLIASMYCSRIHPSHNLVYTPPVGWYPVVPSTCIWCSLKILVHKLLENSLAETARRSIRHCVHLKIFQWGLTYLCGVHQRQQQHRQQVIWAPLKGRQLGQTYYQLPLWHLHQQQHLVNSLNFTLTLIGFYVSHCIKWELWYDYV